MSAVVHLVFTATRSLGQPIIVSQVKSSLTERYDKDAIITLILDSNFKIGSKIGAGAFGNVYSAVNTCAQKEVAIKVQNISKGPSLLQSEAKIYQLLNSHTGGPIQGIPNLIMCKSSANYNLIVLDLLGPSLEDFHKLCNNQFSLKTVLMIADQLLTRIEYIHSKGVVHRDLKPSNLLVGRGENIKTIYTVDFGVAKQYMENGVHISCETRKWLLGTARYASINTHRGLEQSRRDDLESVGYILIYHLKGSLPWQGLGGDNHQMIFDRITDKKVQIPIASLCKDLPAEFAEYLTYVRNLNFSEEPDYKFLRELFNKLFEKEGYIKDDEYDWITAEKNPKSPIQSSSKSMLGTGETARLISQSLTEEYTNGKIKLLGSTNQLIELKNSPKNIKEKATWGWISFFGCSF